MTTSVAIAAQYALDNPNKRATANEIVPAMAVRIECMSDGRFCCSHFQSFTQAVSLTGPMGATSISSPHDEDGARFRETDSPAERTA